MVTSQDVVDVIDATWSKSNLREISWPGTSVGILGSVLREIRWVYSVVDIPVSLIPFLVVVLFEVMVPWTYREHTNHICRLELTVCFVQECIVLLLHNTVTVCTVSGENLESSSNATGIVSSPEGELRPVEMSSVSSDFRNLLFVTFDTPESSNVISEDPSLSCSIFVPGKVAQSSSCDSIHSWLSLVSPSLTTTRLTMLFSSFLY